MKSYSRRQIRQIPGRGHVLTFTRRDPRPEINEIIKIGDNKYMVVSLEMRTTTAYPVTTYVVGAVLQAQ